MVIMKAAEISQYGGPGVIKVNDANRPQIRDNQVLVEVHAASLNPFDSAVREGKMQEMKQLDFPATLGGDIAGVVYETGKDVKDFTSGDNVYGQASVFGGGSGALAEFAATPAKQIAKMPDGLSYAQAASIPLTGVAALQALTEHLELKKGQKLLIQGGSGGIGIIAIQIAKDIGAYVATTVSPKGLDYAKQLGSDEVIDYKSQDFTELVKDYDAVLDLVGGDVLNKSLGCLKSGGRAVSTVSEANKQHAKEKQIETIYQGTEVNTQKLDRLRELVDKDAISENIDKIFTLDEAAKAFEYRESNEVLGKVVMKIR